MSQAQWKVLEGLHKKLKVRHSVATNKYCSSTRRSIEKPRKGVLGAMIFYIPRNELRRV